MLRRTFFLLTAAVACAAPAFAQDAKELPRPDGKPAAGLEIELIRGGTRYRNAQGEIKATTDAKGEFSVTWPEAGMYWLETSTTDSKTSVPQAKQRRLSYVGTFEVLPQ